MGAVMEKLGTRKAGLINMGEISGYLRMEFVIPARGDPTSAAMNC